VPVAALIGIRLSTAKSVANILGAACLLLFTVLLVRDFGLTGLIVAQILQQLAILAAAWAMLSVAVNGTRRLRLRLSFDPAIIRRTASVSFAIQANGMIASLLDVVIKFALTRWGGAAATGLFELATRFVNVVRSLLVTPVNLAVPPFARALAKRRHRVLARLYSRQMRLLMLACLVFYGLALLGSPIISLVVLGRLDAMFFVYFVAQWFASIVNVLSAPSAALGVAAGDMRGNIAGTATMVIGSAVFGNWLGYHHGGAGTLAATTLAVAAGSLMTLAINCARYRLRPFPDFGHGPGGRSSLGGMLSPLVR
jgi:O-antigen/teichoic acid export membrane protein